MRASKKAEVAGSNPAQKSVAKTVGGIAGNGASAPGKRSQDRGGITPKGSSAGRALPANKRTKAQAVALVDAEAERKKTLRNARQQRWREKQKAKT
jgi:hypothetical protein